MAMFPLSPELGELHDDVLWYASALQNTIAAHGGCQTMASEALNALAFNAVLAHRGVRTLCEEGWTPLTPILNRTLIDIFANCIAVLNRPEQADYMGFKYISDFHRKWLSIPEITEPERAAANAAIEMFVGRLSPGDQDKARELIREGRPRTYWFQPEYNTTRELLEVSPHDIHGIYKLFSPVSHGGFSGKLLFNDDPGSEDIEPRQHPRNTQRAIVASSRLLLEVCYVRDHWDNLGAAEEAYNELVVRINASREL
jgi:hypothetical protein